MTLVSEKDEPGVRDHMKTNFWARKTRHVFSFFSPIVLCVWSRRIRLDKTATGRPVTRQAAAKSKCSCRDASRRFGDKNKIMTVIAGQVCVDGSMGQVAQIDRQRTYG